MHHLVQVGFVVGGDWPVIQNDVRCCLFRPVVVTSGAVAVPRAKKISVLFAASGPTTGQSTHSSAATVARILLSFEMQELKPGHTFVPTGAPCFPV